MEKMVYHIIDNIQNWELYRKATATTSEVTDQELAESVSYNEEKQKKYGKVLAENKE